MWRQAYNDHIVLECQFHYVYVNEARVAIKNEQLLIVWTVERVHMNQKYIGEPVLE